MADEKEIRNNICEDWLKLAEELAKGQEVSNFYEEKLAELTLSDLLN